MLNKLFSKLSPTTLWKIGAILVSLAFFSLITKNLTVSRQQPTTIIEYSLNNNLDVLFCPVNSELVSIQAWFRTGALQERTKTNGLSHFLEHMLFKNRALVAELEQRGGVFNAATSHDFTYYYITLPAQEAPFAITALGEMLFNSSFELEDFAQEKQVILEELSRAQDSPGWQIHNFINAKIYGSHPYGQTVLGTKQQLENYKLTELVDYYNKFYAPNNCTFVITGGFNKNQTWQALKRLEQYQAKPAPPLLLRENNLPVLSQTKKIKNLTLPRLVYVYSVPGINSSDLPTLYALSDLLANRLNALLNKRLLQELDLTYQISASYQTRKYRSLFLLNLPLKQTGQLATVKKEYATLLQAPKFSEEELTLVKAKLTKDFLRYHEDITNIASGLGYYHTLDNYRHWRDYLIRINQVSLGDINNVLDKYFHSGSEFLFLPE